MFDLLAQEHAELMHSDMLNFVSEKLMNTAWNRKQENNKLKMLVCVPTWAYEQANFVMKKKRHKVQYIFDALSRALPQAHNCHMIIAT